MAKLRNRNLGIPNGIRYTVPHTKWQSRPNSSFQGVCEALYRHLQGNPEALKQLGWPLDMKFIEEQVDSYNAAIAKHFGWTDYYTEEGGAATAAPFPGDLARSAPASAPQPARARRKCCGGR